MGVWMFIGVCISVYSKTPLRAALNSFMFFIGMVGSYYIYTIKIAGFFPKSYMMIWIAMTVLSLFLGAVCWYAKGTHVVSVCISAVVFMMFARQAFYFGFWYFDISYIPELILWAATIMVLYKSPKQITCVLVIGTALFFIMSQINLFGE
ncbi:IS1595 family transposase ISPana1 [bioreactor metagenome]|uniref:IS1595 family transposase ISPana1 n=1 Tax=bioreactor metagenome TaxID=1076179 RepID=A0A645CNQ7_9ZZZZ